MAAFDEVEVWSEAEGAWRGGYELADELGPEQDRRYLVRRHGDTDVRTEVRRASEVRPPQRVRDVVDELERRYLLDPETRLPRPPVIGHG